MIHFDLPQTTTISYSEYIETLLDHWIDLPAMGADIEHSFLAAWVIDEEAVYASIAMMAPLQPDLTRLNALPDAQGLALHFSRQHKEVIDLYVDKAEYSIAGMERAAFEVACRGARTETELTYTGPMDRTEHALRMVIYVQISAEESAQPRRST